MRLCFTCSEWGGDPESGSPFPCQSPHRTVETRTTRYSACPHHHYPWQSPDFAMPIRFTPCDVQTMDGSVFNNVVWSASGQAWISPSGYHFPWTVEYWRVR